LHKNRAFTLIELLVVIAIIAILAAILFPVFAQAKIAAKKASALSNVKQNALAVIMYVGDADGVYPPVVRMDNGDGYVPQNGQPGNIVYAVFDAIIPYTKNKDIFLSPGDPKAIHWSESPNIGTTITGGLSGGMWVSANKIQYASFGPNFRLFEDQMVKLPYLAPHPVRSEGGIPEPAGTTMFYDARFIPAGQPNKDLTPAQWDAEVAKNPWAAPYRQMQTPFSRWNFPGTPRYSGALVVNFADGHATAAKGNASLPGVAPEGAAPEVRVYNFPYDLNGIPGVVAEDKG
jgi:prepilin-type N-terminal cleavage/methylation domain-containing protein